MDITIAERDAGGVTVLELAGRLTIDGGAQRLKDAINALVARGRTRILVNLHDVPYIDSGGLGQLVASYGSVVKSGGALKLLHTSARNHHLLVITHLVTVFDSFDTESDALRSFAEGQTPEAGPAAAVHSAMGTNPA